ncbi:manganese efflux pump family protein [Sphingomonas sanguinis]
MAMAADFDLPGETNDALPLSWPEVDCVVRLTALGRISMTGLLTLGALGASLSVDAFAAAVGKGATNQRNRWRDALRVGAVFGFFEAITPAIGWAIGLALSTWIAAVDHWIAFFLLFGVGGHMIHAATKSDVDAGQRAQTGVWRLVVTALATSIDATAVGVSLAVMQVNILTACLIIGGITTVVATIGVMLGKHAGRYIGRYAEMLGGLTLILIGGTILYQHLTA